jgi:predicted phage replisome organizer
MRERKVVKFRIDMYDDTKSKIIDMKPERDLIHYVWTRFVVLAGKVNLEGDLYLSKNIPYTIETLAIEFNRGTYQVKLALDVLIELEMIKITGNNVYRVKNFAKHQNIKAKEKSKSNDKEENVKNDEVEAEVEENSLNEAAIDREEISLEVAVSEDEKAENKTSKDKEENVKEKGMENLKIVHKNINENEDNISDNNVGCGELNNSQDNIPTLPGTKKNKKSNKRKKKEVNIETFDEEIEEDMLCCFHEGDEGRPLDEGESVLKAWTF